MVNKLRAWAVPLGLLAVLIASFGLLIPYLGFYWDDWTVLITARMRGIPGYWEYYAFDRPFLPWIYEVFMPFLQTNPIAWQVFALLMRWGTAVFLWKAISNIWQKRKMETALAAFLFAIYPIFNEQSVALQYSQQWICYFLYALSMALMVWAWRRTGPMAWILTVLAVIASAFQMFSMEYFVGLELLRPLFLWILISEKEQKILKKGLTVFLGWLPYLLPLVAFLLWRLFFLKLPLPDPNTPSLLFNFFKSPLTVSAHLLQLAIQDIIFMLVTAWANLFTPTNIQLDDRFVLLSWGLALAVAAGSYALLRWVIKTNSPAVEDTSASPSDKQTGFWNRPWPWSVQAILMGLAAILVGMLPIWTTDRQLMVGMHSDRFGMPAMFGAALIVVALISWLGISFNKQILFVCLLVGLAAGQDLRTANDYRWAWVSESRFYWQLNWRAPAIKPNTSIFADGEFLSYMSGNAITTGINLMYKTPEHPTYTLPLYFYSLGRDYSYRMDDFLAGSPTKENSYRIYHFNGSTSDALVIDYNPTKNNCLHVLSSEDKDVPGLPPLTAKALANSKLSLILDGPAQPGYPPADIYGPAPDMPWCRIYEKAELARQNSDWKTVVSLGDQAAQKGYSLDNSTSNTPYEWLPFVEGYAHSGNLDLAKKISTDILKKNSLFNVRLCELWSKIHDNMPDKDFGSILTNLGCTAK